MAAIPDGIETDTTPPLTVPLRHFLVGIVLLVGAAALWTLSALDAAPAMAGVATRHLLVAGWVCITIMGAMTQFVPVWAGVTLHSDRLAVAQLWLFTAGIVGVVGHFLTGALASLPYVAVLAVAGALVFAYNVGRTIASAGRPDVTTGHFAVALCWMVVVPLLGVVLGLLYGRPGLVSGLPVTRMNVLLAHVTGAVFGIVLTTVLGAIYQLVQMFTQSEFDAVDRWLVRGESVAYPVGVAALAGGRLAGVVPLARVGAVLTVSGVAVAAVVVGRQLLATRTEWTPVLTRYAVVVAAMLLWAGLTLPSWLADPTAYLTRFGPEPAASVLLLGVLLFVVVGTLYHVVPFVVWFHRYSDRLGLEKVPMIDDLYDDRLAAVDSACLSVGAVVLVVGEAGLVGSAVIPFGAGALLVGTLVFGANMLVVVRGHSPYSIPAIVLSERLDGRTE
jgi:hypothetical protein